MVRIRYIGEQLIARAFNHTFHRNHWDDNHGLDPVEILTVTANPQFEVEKCPEARVAISGAGEA